MTQAAIRKIGLGLAIVLLGPFAIVGMLAQWALIAISTWSDAT